MDLMALSLNINNLFPMLAALAPTKPSSPSYPFKAASLVSWLILPNFTSFFKYSSNLVLPSPLSLLANSNT
tara:strand:- start:202 stop:414 length:213 start_codon:yes stop_codon:yes gene_type:complete